MISVENCRLLARYNRWMNERMYAVVADLSEEERTRERSAFFGSIHRTLNHILWGDRIWLARFLGEPYTVAAFGTDMYADFAALTRERAVTDTAILGWTGKLTPAWLSGVLEYRSVSDPRLRRVDRWIAVAHMFQHATHHRGQLSTLITQSGRDIGATDLPAMPGVIEVIE
jgi:uncharacterized damage-inducible protein DinB